MLPTSPDPDPSRRFGQLIRLLREEQGWSQEALAEFAALNRSFVGDLERGAAVPSLTTIDKLAAAFGITPSGLLSRLEAGL